MRVRLANYEKDFVKEREVTNFKDYENKQFMEDGIFSEKIFGSYQDDSLEEGWIDFGNNQIINPLLFRFLKKVIPKLPRIIKKESSIDLEGNIVDVAEIDNIGLYEFINNFDYYLGEYGNVNCPEWEFLSRNLDVLFISKFPIISSKLRPGILINGVITGSTVNKKYKFLIRYSNELRNSNIDIEGDIKISNLLFGLQNYANQIIKEINDNFLRKKNGWIRNHMMGSRINYSARNVIAPLVMRDGMRIDEVSMPYKTYLELYKKQLINLIVHTKGVSYVKANLEWRKSTLKFTPSMYKYIQILNTKTKGGQYILLNRNPTISVSSIVLLRIASIKTDYSDDTLQISNNILPGLNGDYDGDVLNIVPLFNRFLVETFKCFSPSRLMVDPNDGRFNSNFSLQKEQKLGIYILNNETIKKLK